ncbi:hypothetical protein J132_03628 [Termitomyces sp. J132]|nr:hypothetical protein J132_03628 [Termitomyces sp. J132]
MVYVHLHHLTFVTQAFLANVHELETIASQYGRRVTYDLSEASLHSFTVVASVNGTSYYSTHQNTSEAREIAAGHALRELRQQLLSETSTSFAYHPRMPGYPITPTPLDYTAHKPIPHHMATKPHKHYRMELNNMAAARGLGHVQYEREGFTGSQHKPRWFSTAYVGGMKCGQGYGNSKGVAREQAAKQALEYLTGLNYEIAHRSQAR